MQGIGHCDLLTEREQLLETGGGIKKAVPLLKEQMAEDFSFLVHNVDILSNVNLSEFYRLGTGRAALLLVSERETQRYLLFNEENRLVGWTNMKTGEVKSPYPDLDLNACKKLAFAGVHMFSSRLFPYFSQWGDKFSIIDFYLSVCDKEPIYGCPYPDLRLMDVGKLDSLEKAEFFLSE
jgi:NDP-sugar pyrophosphorylase family protein